MFVLTVAVFGRYALNATKRIPFPLFSTLVAAAGTRYWAGADERDLSVLIPIPDDLTTLSVDVLRDDKRLDEVVEAARSRTKDVIESRRPQLARLSLTKTS